MDYKIGGHVSIAGGYTNALIRAKEIGANCLQMFSSSPRIWKNQEISSEQIEEFKIKKRELGINPIYFHASYLINMADNGLIGERSKEALVHELGLAEELGVLGTIIHVGSYGIHESGSKNYELGISRFEDLVSNIQYVLNNSAETFFIIENAGNKKIGVSFSEIGRIIRALNNIRVRVCLDTCHLWAAGYDFSTQKKLDAMLEEFDREIGLEKLEVFQVNDSKGTLGSFLDRHENIGQGTIGLEPFRLLLNDPRTKQIPFILEVPGMDHKGGPDKGNIEVLRSLTD